MPWCWRCGTGISQHEIVTEGYIEKSRPAASRVRIPAAATRPGESLLVWTTTPWTLTSNVAAAVGPDLTYVKVKQGDDDLLSLEGDSTKMLKGAYEVVGRAQGPRHGRLDVRRSVRRSARRAARRRLDASLTMRRLFADIAANAVEAHRVIAVGRSRRGGRHGHRPHRARLRRGRLCAGQGERPARRRAARREWRLHRRLRLAHRQARVAKSPTDIVDDLKSKGIFYTIEKYTHRYPACWRCDTPLVFRLVDEWFISMDGLRDEIMDVVRPDPLDSRSSARSASSTGCATCTTG